jgi:hypothetical protein
MGSALESPTFAGLRRRMLVGIQGILDCGCTDPAEIGAAIAELEGFDGLHRHHELRRHQRRPDKPVSIHRVEGGVDTLAATSRGSDPTCSRSRD